MSAEIKYSFHAGADAVARSKWVGDRIDDTERGWEHCVTMEITRGGEIIGGVVFHDYNPEAGTIGMSAAGVTGWLTRRVIAAIHGYVFGIAGCQLAVLDVSENNSLMLRVARAVGYREHRIPRLRGRDEAAMILTLSDDDWRRSKFNR